MFWLYFANLPQKTSLWRLLPNSIGHRQDYKAGFHLPIFRRLCSKTAFMAALNLSMAMCWNYWVIESELFKIDQIWPCTYWNESLHSRVPKFESILNDNGKQIFYTVGSLWLTTEGKGGMLAVLWDLNA